MQTSLAPSAANTSPAAAALPAIVAAIANAVQPQAIVVFGSVARGTAGPASDVDLLVVDDFEAKGRGRMDSLSMAYKALVGVCVAIDLVVVSPAEFARWKDSPFNVVGVCAREGVVCHGRL